MILKLTKDILCSLFKNIFIIWLLVRNKFIRVILLFKKCLLDLFVTVKKHVFLTTIFAGGGSGAGKLAPLEAGLVVKLLSPTGWV